MEHNKATHNSTDRLGYKTSRNRVHGTQNIDVKIILK
jgi:hypothetical protein